jgi:hypothetical protein
LPEALASTQVPVVGVLLRRIEGHLKRMPDLPGRRAPAGIRRYCFA